MGLIRTFTSFSGRLSRRGFWFGMLSLLLLGSAASVGTTPDIFSDDPFKALLDNWRQMGIKDVAIYLALLYPAMALVVKRLHDRNKSGLVATLFWAPALLQSATVIIPGLDAFMDTIMRGYELLAAWIGVVGTWFFVELGFYGAREPNKYGTDPR